MASKLPFANWRKLVWIGTEKKCSRGLIGRRLIAQALRRANLEVTPEDIDGEIARAAGSMLPPVPMAKPDVKKWLALATEQLGVSEELYRSEVVWRAVALRKLVASQVKVTDEDLQKAFEANYGPRVRLWHRPG